MNLESIIYAVISSIVIIICWLVKPIKIKPLYSIFILMSVLICGTLGGIMAQGPTRECYKVIIAIMTTLLFSLFGIVAYNDSKNNNTS
jgi:hypothetical protein